MIEVKKTSIQIPTDMLIEIKAMAVKQGTTQNTIINNLIAKGMEKTKQKGKIKAKKINHEMPGYDPKREGNLANIIGTADVNEEIAKNLDVNELIDSIHTKKELY